MTTENQQLEPDFDQVEQPEPVQDDNDFPLEAGRNHNVIVDVDLKRAPANQRWFYAVF